ncbi:hypothetical protein [Brevibacterium iodinum]|nr:hypothetical protein [Brevibacterium iodinum]
MGLNANILIADTTLTDADLAGIDLQSTVEELTAEAVLLTPAEDRACVVRADGCTIIVDGSDALAEAIDDEAITLPGRIVSAAVVSSVGFSDFLIVDDGHVVRHLCEDDGEIRIDEGQAVPGESDFVFPAEPDEDESADASADGAVDRDGTDAGAVEIDGDLLIQLLPAVAGMDADTDLFALAGTAYTRASAGLVGSDGEPAPAEGAEPARKGLFSRLFRR